MKEQKQKKQPILFWVIFGILGMGFFFCGIQTSRAIEIAQVATPPKNGIVLNQPMEIYGFAPKNSIVHFWVDGKYLGGTKVKNPKNKKNANGTFTYTVKKTYKPGTHTLKTRVIKGAEKSDYIDQQFTIPDRWYRKLDGKQVKIAEWNKLPLAVMIENTTAARPQAGLSEASVVYETLAEGGVTRFIAIFPQGVKPKNIGPVRSARYYYVDIASEYNALFVHSGGSPDAYSEIKRLLVRSYDGLSKTGAKYQYRKCYGVHCMFTDGNRLAQLVKNANIGSLYARFQGWKFKNADALTIRPKHTKVITVNFNSPTYRVNWKYDRKSNAYKRSVAGIAARDRNTGKQLAFNNIIIQRVPQEKVVDRKGRIILPLTGSGKATLYRDGKVIQLRWKKKSSSTRTLFYDMKGKEIEFNRGNTWVELVPGNRSVTYR